VDPAVAGTEEFHQVEAEGLQLRRRAHLAITDHFGAARPGIAVVLRERDDAALVTTGSASLAVSVAQMPGVELLAAARTVKRRLLARRDEVGKPIVDRRDAVLDAVAVLGEGRCRRCCADAV
jgi:hypothetical protein